MKMLTAISLFLSAVAYAGPPVVLVEAKVAQYREAAEAAKRHLSGSIEVDPSDPAAAAKLNEAPVVVAVGQKSLAMAKASAEKVPVVFCMVLGLNKSLLGTGVTGVPIEADPSVVITHIRSISKETKRVGFVYNPSSADVLLKEAERAAKAQGVSLVLKPVTTPAEVKDAMTQMVGSIDALWLPPDPKLFSKELFAFLLTFSAERRLPLFGFLESFTQAGALASVSPDYGDIGDRAGRLANQIIGNRGQPVPPPVFAPGNLSVNLKTAKALGIDVPPQALASAKQVFR
jgi:putative tryptophan/tyrosine transport system substrate-binding protein